MTEILTFSKCIKNNNNDDNIKSFIWLRKQQMLPENSQCMLEIVVQQFKEFNILLCVQNLMTFVLSQWAVPIQWHCAFYWNKMTCSFITLPHGLRYSRTNNEYTGPVFVGDCLFSRACVFWTWNEFYALFDILKKIYMKIHEAKFKIRIV